MVTRAARMARATLLLLVVHRALGAGAGLDALDDLVEVVADGEAVHVLWGDHPVGQDALAQPVDEAAPVRRADQHDRELAHLARLDERQRLEELVERPEATGEHDERVRVADEHDLAREEVVVLERVGDVAVGVLLKGQLDVQPDRARAGLASAAVGGLHGARPAAGDDREAGLAEPAADLARQLVVLRARRRARRAEHRDAAVDAVQRLEPHLDLRGHPRDALLVGDQAQDGRDLGAEDLLVVGERAMGGLGHLTASLPVSSGVERAMTWPCLRGSRALPVVFVVAWAPPSVRRTPLSGWSRPR